MKMNWSEKFRILVFLGRILNLDLYLRKIKEQNKGIEVNRKESENTKIS